LLGLLDAFGGHLRFSVCARATIVRTTASLSGSWPSRLTKDRSILSVSMGKRLKYASEELARSKIVDSQVDAQRGQPGQPRRVGVLHEHALR